MKHISRDIDPGEAQDLLERAPRASLAFAGDDGPCAQPIACVWRDGRYLVGLPATIDLQVEQEVVLLLDEGVRFFDLRAMYIRGRVRPIAAPATTPANHTWFEVTPIKTVAWDYGTLHEVQDAS